MFQALGLAAVPLARLLDRGRGLRVAAGVMLVLHLLTPQAWPVANQESGIPWDLTPLIKNAVGSPLLLFTSMAGVLHAGAGSTAIPNLVILLGMGFCAGLTAWGASRIGQPTVRRSRILILTAIGSVALVGLAGWHTGAAMLDARQLFYPPFRDFYLGWMDLEGRSGPSGARVAYAGTNIPYYLFGTGLRNDVRYVNVDAHRDWLMHDYHRAAIERSQPTWPNSTPGLGPGSPELPRMACESQSPASPAPGGHEGRSRRGAPQRCRQRRVSDRTSLGRCASRSVRAALRPAAE